MSTEADSTNFSGENCKAAVPQVGEALAAYKTDASLGGNAETESIRASQLNEALNDTDVQLRAVTERDWERRRRSVGPVAEMPGGATEKPPFAATAFSGDVATELPSELTEQSHCRRDMLTGDLTIFAPGRELRPDDFRQGEHDVAIESKSDSTPRGVSTEELLVPDCPFCRGGESQTPEAVWSAKLVDSKMCRLSHDGNRFSPPTADISSEDREGWDVRVVPNKFPAVTPFGPGEIEHEGSSFLFPISRVCGGHEVFIESSSHIERLTENDSSLIYLTLLAYRDRIRHWRETDGVKYISIFKNCGRAAGASLRHSHSQLVATSVMPHRIQIALQRMESHRSRYGSSLGCDLLRGELAQGSRVVARADEFVAFCPFASRFPGMMRITTRDHQPHFDQFSESTLDRLASFLWRTLRWIAEAYPGKSYNYLLHTCPPAASDPGAFQWSIDLFPRLSQIAGFEWSSACQINSELPEVAAFNYREIAGQDDPRRVLALR